MYMIVVSIYNRKWDNKLFDKDSIEFKNEAKVISSEVIIF